MEVVPCVPFGYQQLPSSRHPRNPKLRNVGKARSREFLGIYQLVDRRISDDTVLRLIFLHCKCPRQAQATSMFGHLLALLQDVQACLDITFHKCRIRGMKPAMSPLDLDGPLSGWKQKQLRFNYLRSKVRMVLQQMGVQIHRGSRRRNATSAAKWNGRPSTSICS